MSPLEPQMIDKLISIKNNLLKYQHLPFMSQALAELTVSLKVLEVKKNPQMTELLLKSGLPETPFSP